MDYTVFESKIPDGFNGCFLAQFSDAYVVGEWPKEKETISDGFEKLLEIRIFNKGAEYKLFRSSIGADLQFRAIDSTIEDALKPGYDYYDEDQFLDIDTNASVYSFRDRKEVFATGGGQYRLPTVSMNNTKIRIRCYFDRYDSGQVKISDWRVVEFVEGQ